MYPPPASQLASQPAQTSADDPGGDAPGMSQLLTEIIGRIFNEKKTFIESVRERRKIRRQRIARLFQSFQFTEQDTQGAGAPAAATVGEDKNSEQSSSEAHKSVRTDPSPIPSHLKTNRLSFDPNNEFQLQEEIQRILDHGDDDLNGSDHENEDVGDHEGSDLSGDRGASMSDAMKPDSTSTTTATII